MALELGHRRLLLRAMLCVKELLLMFSIALYQMPVVDAIDENVVTYLGNRIVDAINCGGGEHVDIHGIRYRSDPLEGKSGVSSDYGKRYLIGRVPQHDLPLYQTERYSTSNFHYTINIKDDGNYVLVLKFSEVYFDSPNKKTFSVHINDQHAVVSDLDIFAKVGRATAHDEVIPFAIQKGQLRIYDQVSPFAGKLHIQLIKGAYDNPKLNALYVMKGDLNDVPPLPPMKYTTLDEDEGIAGDLDISDTKQPAETEEETEKRRRVASGPAISNPYEAQDNSQMFLPILIALACFFPVLFCLCKL